MNLNESFLSTEGNLMTSVSPDKLRPRWRIWVTAVNYGFLIPNRLSLENLAGGGKKKKINVTYTTQRPFTALLWQAPFLLLPQWIIYFSRGGGSWQKVVRVCCFPFSQGNCVLRAFMQYNIGWHGSRTPPIFYNSFRQNIICCHAELPLRLMRTMILTKFLTLYL